MKYCEAQLYTVEKIQKRADRTPDFRVVTAHGAIIAEVKEACANGEDERIATHLKQRRKAASWWDRPGKRVRAMIGKANGQTRSSLAEGLPCVVILYDNVIVGGDRPRGQNYFFTGLDIAIGMYGQLKTAVMFSGNAITGTRNELGGDRTLRFNKEKQISAVCVLTDGTGTPLPFMRVYHNSYAARPLPREIFCGAHDKHMKNPGDNWLFENSWVEF